MKVLLDTNAYVALRRGDEAVAALVRNAERVVLSAIVTGELLHGFRNGTRAQDNTRDLARFLEQPGVTFVPVGWDTADRFGRIATSGFSLPNLVTKATNGNITVAPDGTMYVGDLTCANLPFCVGNRLEGAADGVDQVDRF